MIYLGDYTHPAYILRIKAMSALDLTMFLYAHAQYYFIVMSENNDSKF